MKKRMAALTLCVIMMLSLIPIQAFAWEIEIQPFYPNADAS